MGARFVGSHHCLSQAPALYCLPGIGLPRYTCSFGVATLDGAQDSFEAMLKRSDVGLYRAKEGGRDRVATG
jgi:GGDEF domain-containing protein